MRAMSADDDPTALLLAWRAGDRAAFERLVPLVNEELRRLARAYMARERGGHTLQPTALVNEAYLRLINVQHTGHRGVVTDSSFHVSNRASLHVLTPVPFCRVATLLRDAGRLSRSAPAIRRACSPYVIRSPLQAKPEQESGTCHRSTEISHVAPFLREG
jgi:hypothetical protein